MKEGKLFFFHAEETIIHESTIAHLKSPSLNQEKSVTNLS